MRWFRAFVLALALLASASFAGAQDKSSRTYTLPVAHVVTLGWSASTTPNVTYNVYVSGTTGGPYTRIGNTSILMFADVGTTAGNKYFYVVTAIDSSGNESVFSNEISVTIPTP